MKRQDRIENTPSTNNRVHFGSGQAQSSSKQAQPVSVQSQPASDWVIQLLLNKNKRTSLVHFQRICKDYLK